MLKRTVTLAALMCLVLTGTAVHAQDNVVGYWVGRAVYQNEGLPIEFAFELTRSGVEGFLSAPTIRALRYPLRKVSQTGSQLSFELVGDSSTFTFRGAFEGNSLTGTWNLFGVAADVVMTRSTVPTIPYRREPITCRNRGVSLEGTLFIPAGPGPYPAVVFVHGSGAETRDASSFLADRLARAGIAALTYDKRSAGASTGNWREADFGDLAGDVLACINVLKSRNEIDGSSIGLAGASQAGWVAPLAASQSKDVAFMALVSGPAVPVWREGWWDTEFRLRDGGFGEAELEKARAILRLNDEVTRAGSANLPALTRLLEAARTEPWFPALGFQQAPPADAPFRRFYRGIIDFDPVPILERLSIPSLWLLGDRDAEMPSAETATILERVKAQGKPMTVKMLTGADHSLFSVQAGPAFHWPRLAPGYIEIFVDWVLETTKAR